MTDAWLTLLRNDVEAFAQRLIITAELADENKGADANYWFLSAEDRSSLADLPSDFMVGSIADDLMVLGTLSQGAAPERIHLEAIASILLYLAAREEPV